LRRLAGFLDRGLAPVKEAQETIRQSVQDVIEVWATLDPAHGDQAQRAAAFEAVGERFQASDDVVRQQMAGVMRGFAPGLFVGGDDPELPRDNLDLERWFRLAKGHERRIHGHRHVGVRLVQDGPTLLPALDAHASHHQPFGVEDLWPYRRAQPPRCQREAIHRRKVMRKARSKKRRSLLLADLERRYLADP
jgi:hypothetical protein